MVTDRRATAVRLRRQGWTLQAIADKLRVSRQAIHRLVNTPASRQAPGRRPLTINAAEADRLYRRGKTLKELAARYGVSVDTVRKRLADRGVPIRRAGRPTAKKPPARRRARVTRPRPRAARRC